MQTRKSIVAAVAGVAVLLAACGGEDRPNVDVINDGTPGSGTGSVSASVSASGALPAPTRAPGQTGYSVVSNVDVYFAIGADFRDMRELMQPAASGGSVDWAAVKAIYEQGKNQVNPNTGAVRAPAALANDARHAMFPNGPAVYGRPNFIDALIRDGLDGTGRAQGQSDAVRRQIVDKGLSMLAYAVAMQEMAASRTRLEQGNTDNNTGAPHTVDEAWATTAGPTDANGNRPYSLLGIAASREGNFNLQGKIAVPLESAYVAALGAAQKGDMAAFDRAHAEVRGLTHAIFYLSTLRYAKVAENAADENARRIALTEGWTYWQTIRAQVAQASSSAAQTVEDAYSRNPANAFPASTTTAVYDALNQPAVLQALGIPATLVVRTAP